MNKTNLNSIFSKRKKIHFNRVNIFEYVKQARKKKKIFSVIAISLVLLSIGYIIFGGEKYSAATLDFDSGEILSGFSEYNNIDTSVSESISLQAGDKGSWTNEESPIEMPNMASYSDMIYGPSNTLYKNAGDGSSVFSRYWIEERRWEQLAPIPIANTSKLVFDGTRYIYMIGDTYFNFFRYDINADAWEKMANTPRELGAGSTITYVNQNGGEVYGFRGDSTAYFWKYSVTSNAWAELAATEFLVSRGSDIIWDGGNFLFLMPGINGRILYKYTIDQGTWVSMGDKYPSMYSYYFSRFTRVSSDELIYWDYRGAEFHKTMYKYTISTNTLTAIATPDSLRDETAVAYNGSDKLYVTFGINNRGGNNLRVYDLNTQIWDNNQINLSEWPTEDSALIDDNSGGAYYIRSSSARPKFSHIDFATGTITDKMSATQDFTDFPIGVVSGGKLWAFRGYGNSKFYNYDIATNSWNDDENFPLSEPPETVHWGSDILDGENGFLYFIRGGNADHMYKYEMASDTWTQVANAPFNVYYGGAIEKVGGYIYAISGADRTGRMAKYEIATNTWTVLDVATISPGWPYIGTRMTSDGTDNLYIALGPQESDEDQMRWFYKFNVTTSTWTRLADVPVYIRGWSPQSAIYEGGNVYLIRGNADVRLWKWTASVNAYKTSGTWFSKHYDLTQVSSFGDLTYSESGTGTATIYTRSSSDGVNWESWIALSGNIVQSLAKRYFQMKVVLSGDGTATPTISNINLEYNQETQAPSLPSEFKAYSASGGDLLVSGNTYPHHHPYFEWSGSTDGVGGSGVAGYYVYFGLNSSADPVVSGSYQTSANYTADLPMTAGDVDYLRIKVKDKLGNISAASTFFSYRYWFVSPPGSVSVASKADFDLGTSVGIDKSDANGSLKLNHQSNGAWSNNGLIEMPQTYRGGCAAYVGGSIYVNFGNNNRYFYRYDLNAQEWARLADVNEPSAANYYGCVLTYDDAGSIYYMDNDSTTYFGKYNIGTNIWSNLDNLPTPSTTATSMKKVSNNRFMMTFNGSQFSYIYDPVTIEFTELPPTPTSREFTTSTNLYYDGDEQVYALVDDNFLIKYNFTTNIWTELSSAPAEFQNTSNFTFDGFGGNLYFFAQSQSENNTAYRFSISEERFYKISSPEVEPSHGFMPLSDGSRYIYLIYDTYSGDRRDNIIMKYDTLLDRYMPDLFTPGKSYYYNAQYWTRWGTETGEDYSSSSISSITYDGENLVYIKKNDSIWVYDIENQSMVDAYSTIYYGYGAIVYSNGYLYMPAAGNTNRFFRVNVKSWEWEELANIPTASNHQYSQNMVVDSSGRIYLATAGGTTNFYRYIPGTDSWDTLTVLPTAANTGFAISYDGSDTIYVAPRNITNFYSYTISTGLWSQKANITIGVPYGGASLTYNNGYVYMMRGYNTKTMGIYDVSLNTWASGPDSPVLVYYGGGMARINSEYALLIPGNGSATVWRYSFPGGSIGYNGIGTYTSKNFLIPGVFSYVNVEATLNLPAETSVEFETRTTDDGVIWSDWQRTTLTKSLTNGIITHVNSPMYKNIQVRVTLYSYDNVYTPAVSDFKVNYYDDNTPPNNPTLIDVYDDDQMGEELVNDTWYKYPTPYIDWPDPGEVGGATDGLIGSNIKGYYIYVGPQVDAVPETEGTFVEVSNYTPTLTTSGIYYVRIQTVDQSDNVSEETYHAFAYKFDNVLPDPPAIISSDPAGYTAVNEYSFDWDEVFDEDSGIFEYCYKTGATSGIYSTEQCQSENSLDLLPAAYQQGANILYVRSIDRAGNYSDSTREVTFYYNTGPPSAVTNLEAIPSSSAQNMFSFAWDPPTAYVGNVDKLSYFYSVNQLPSASNTTRTESRSVAEFAAATLPGANSFYVVAKDEAGNISWSSYSFVSFFANTTAPGIPLNVEIVDVSSRISGRYSIALTWDEPSSVGNGISYYAIERSSDELHFNRIGTNTKTAYVDLGLDEGITYWYRIKASDNANNIGGASTVVSTLATGNYTTPPTITSGPNVTVGSTTASISWNTDRDSTSFVRYGLSPSTLNDNKGDMATTSKHTVNIYGLSPNTTYYYKVQSFDLNYVYNIELSYSTLFTFKTLKAASIENVNVSDQTLTSAKISWSAQGMSSYRILYGKSSGYGNNKQGNTSTDFNSVILDNLDHSSLYHFKIICENAGGGEVESDDYLFSTIEYPVISNIKFQPDLSDENNKKVEITWTTNVPTTSEISYQLGASIAEYKDETFSKNHKAVLENLADNASYKITIKGKDQFGNYAISEVQIWSTPIDTREPGISNIEVSTTVNPDTNKVQIIVSWDSNEPSTSQVEYGIKPSSDEIKYESSTEVDTELVMSHVMVISGLDRGNVYHLRPKSEDKSGNISYGEDTISLSKEEGTSILQRIVTILQRLFSRLRF
jgi:hypothetical protein